MRRSGKRESIFNIIWEGKLVVIYFGEGVQLGTHGLSPADARRLAAAFEQHSVFPERKGFAGERPDTLQI